MYTDEDLSSAVKAGIFTEKSVSAFRAHITGLRNVPAVDEEHFRLLTGFNDIFVVIACVLLLISISWIGSSISKPLGALAFTLAAWGLAEFFVLKRRMALPAIILLMAFIGGVVWTSLAIFGDMKTTGFIISGCLAAIAAWIHWQRFKVPVTIAAGTAAAIGCILGLLFTASPQSKQWITPILLIAGLFVFAMAMRWDMADALRQTRKSDVAFWLHLLAAPLLVHPVFTTLGVLNGENSPLQAAVVIALYVAIALVSILIDRRALMISALTYVLYAFSALLKTYGIVSLGFAITGLIIGSALLLLSAFWHSSRTYLIKGLPPSLVSVLPPLR